MDQQELLNKVITIDSVEQTTTKTEKVRFKVKSTEGLTYGLWKLKSDQTESKAYLGLKELGLDAVGKEVAITYKEDKGEYEGKEITYRTIVMLTTDLNSVPKQQSTSDIDILAKINALSNRVGALENAANVSIPDTSEVKDSEINSIPF